MNLQINSLTDTWHDKDEVILHACFQCLVDFIDQEQPTADEFNKDVWNEIIDLYQWWKEERQHKEPAQFDGDYVLDSGNLIRLIMVREYLWT